MAEEMLFTVAGSVAMPAQMISLEEAGFEERADLQEWVLSNPAILGPAVKVITFEIDGLPTAAGDRRDRIHVLGLAIDGRLVVAELKSGRTPDTEVTAIKYAAMASRILPESLAEQYARFQSRRQLPMTPDDALAELQAHAPDLSHETLRRPRVVLLARDFSPVVTASVVWLSEMGLDLALVQISAFRSYVYGQSGASSGNVPMIAVNQIYPLREVEEFTISPERQRAKEMAEAKRRVQDASTVRRLVTSELVADGTIFTLSPPSDLGFDLRNQLEEWLHEDPARRTAYWQNNLTAPLVWDVDKLAYTPAALRPHHHRAGDRSHARTSSARSGGATRPAGVSSSWRARSAAAAARSTATTGRAGSRSCACGTRSGRACRRCRRRTSSRCPRRSGARTTGWPSPPAGGCAPTSPSTSARRRRARRSSR